MWVTEVDEGSAYWSGEAGARPERPGYVIFVGVENGDDCKCGNTASKHLQREESRKGSVDDSQRNEENVAKRKGERKDLGFERREKLGYGNGGQSTLYL